MKELSNGLKMLAGVAVMRVALYYDLSLDLALNVEDDSCILVGEVEGYGQAVYVSDELLDQYENGNYSETSNIIENAVLELLEREGITKWKSI